MNAALVRLPWARVARGPRVWMTLAAWCAFAFVLAVVAHQRGAVHGADHVLVDSFGALVLPLLSYVIVGACVASRSLRASVAPVVTFGAPPMRAAFIVIGVAAVASAALGAGVGAAVAVLAHGIADPPRAQDALVSAYAGALGGTAYAAWFSLGASLGRRGGGRTLFLVADWVLGATTGAGALVTPRAHLRNLLGGAPPMGLSERASAGALLVLAIVCTLIATRRTR